MHPVNLTGCIFLPDGKHFSFFLPLRDGKTVEIIGANRQIGRKMRAVTFRDQRCVSVYHRNIAHCTVRISLNRNSYIET